VTLPGLAPPLRRASFIPALLLGALIVAPAARGADPEPAKETRLLDPARSSAEFEVKVLWFIGVHGRFGKVEGAVTIDRAADSAVAEARIDAERITMRKRSYEDWAKSDEFFDARAFPLIHFTSKPFALDLLRNGGEIAGTLRLRGIDREVTLTLQPSGCPDAIARDCPVEASGSIRRGDFGMKARHGTVSDRVELGFSIFLVDSVPPPPANG
jgi:polyisoprenoid-binding protein YceI